MRGIIAQILLRDSRFYCAISLSLMELSRYARQISNGSRRPRYYTRDLCRTCLRPDSLVQFLMAVLVAVRFRLSCSLVHRTAIPTIAATNSMQICYSRFCDRMQLVAKAQKTDSKSADLRVLRRGIRAITSCGFSMWQAHAAKKIVVSPIASNAIHHWIRHQPAHLPALLIDRRFNPRKRKIWLS
jgi:hypothetical protein